MPDLRVEMALPPLEIGLIENPKQKPERGREANELGIADRAEVPDTAKVDLCQLAVRRQHLEEVSIRIGLVVNSRGPFRASVCSDLRCEIEKGYDHAGGTERFTHRSDCFSVHM